MKTFCRSCGIHFPLDFEVTFLPTCNFWGDHGMANVSKESKSKVWEWLFNAPADEFFIKEGIALTIDFAGKNVPPAETFESQVPGWKEMSELEQQDYERQHYRYIASHGTLPPPGTIVVKPKKVVIN